MAMAMLNFRFTVFAATLAVVGVLLSGEVDVVVGQICKLDLGGVIENCSAYVGVGTPEQDPSQACCDVIKTVDVPCACQYVTKEVEQMIDMNKAVHVCNFCGIPLQHGMQCGSFTVP